MATSWAEFNKRYSSNPQPATAPVVPAANNVAAPVVPTNQKTTVQPATQKIAAPAKTTKTVSSWDKFNQQFASQSYDAEAGMQDDVDPALFKRLKIQGAQTGEIKEKLAPEKVSYGKEFVNAAKTISPFKVLESAFAGVRATTQVAATPLAGAFALGKGGVTPSQAMRESLVMAKQVATQEVGSSDAIDKAGQMWLEKRKIGKYGGQEAGIADIAALATLKFFDIFGDPAFAFGELKAAGAAAKEFATFKKVGQIEKELPAGTSFVKGTTRKFEVPVGKNAKIKIEPSGNTIVLKGYQRRFGNAEGETDELLNSLSEATGHDMSARVVGQDLVIEPKLLKEPRKTLQIEGGGQKMLPEAGTPATVKLGQGFTMVDKADKELVAYGKAKAAYQEQLRNYNTNPTPTKLKRVLSLKKEMESLAPGQATGAAEGVVTTQPNTIFQALAADKEVAETVRTLTPDKTKMPQIKEELPEVKKPEVIQPQLKTSEAKGTENRIFETPKQEEPLKTEAERAEPYKPVEPESGQSRLGKRVEEEAIEAGITREIKDLPEYDKMNIKEQAKMATDLINSDVEKAKRIALGEEMPEGKLLPESVFIAVKNLAKQNKDIELITKLARSHTVSQATFMGQRIRALAETTENDPVKVIREINELRKAKVKEKKPIVKKEKLTEEQKKIQQEIRHVEKTEKEFADFINSLVC